MFTFRTSTSILFTAVIATGLLTPVTGATFAYAQPMSPNVTSPVAQTPVVHEINDQAAFTALFALNGPLAKANAANTTTTLEPHTIRLGASSFRLPERINFPNLALTITSADPVTALGVKHPEAERPKTQGATLTIADPRSSAFASTCVVRSPLVVRDVHIANDVRDKSVFRADHHLVLSNVNGLRSEPYRNVAIVTMKGDAKDAHVEIENSTFVGVSPLTVETTVGTSRFEHNVVRSPSKTGHILKYRLGSGQTPWTPKAGEHLVRNNLFNQGGNTTTIQVQRPGVTIEHNEFTLPTNEQHSAVALEIGTYRTRFNKLPKINQVMFTDNLVTGAQAPAFSEAIVVSYSDSFEPKGFTIARNDFGQVQTALHKGVSWDSDDPIAFTHNFVGNAKVELDPAHIMQPLTQAPRDAGLIKPTPPVPNPQVPNPPAPRPPVVPGPQPPKPSVTPEPSVTPTPSSKYKVQRIAGPTRIETAVAIAQAHLAKGAESVVLARSDIGADSLVAAPLAKGLNAPVLLTQPDQLHLATANEITRLNAKTVYLMGGEQALTPEVERAVINLGVRVVRVAGPNRAGTAVATSEAIAKLGKVTHVLLADGTNWQPSLIAGPVAASTNGVTLLTNGQHMAPETLAYLRANTGLGVTTIGDGATQAFPKATTKIPGADGSVLSVDVAKQFFAKANTVGLATTQDFADALSAGAHMGALGGPLLLVPEQTPTQVTTWIREAKEVKDITIYGGPTRISQAQVDALTTPKP